MSRRTRTLLIVVGALLTLVLIGPLLVPVPPLDDVNTVEELQRPDSEFVQLQPLGEPIEVHYLERGEGERDFILIHGFLASTLAWREVLDPIGELGRAVAYDRPGYGLTERRLGFPYGTDGQVDTLLRLMDTLEIEQAVLVGSSAGGTVAAEFALAHPDRVEALVFVDAAIYAGGGAPAFIRPVLNTPQMDHLGPLIARSLGRSTTLLDGSYYDDTLITEELVAAYQADLMVGPWDEVLWEFTQDSSPFSGADRLPELTMHALVVSGVEDEVVPVEDSRRLAEDLPNAVYAEFEACGHVPMEECPEPFMDALRDFVSSLP